MSHYTLAFELYVVLKLLHKSLIEGNTTPEHQNETLKVLAKAKKELGL